jgi:nicotinamidase-related amidase
MAKMTAALILIDIQQGLDDPRHGERSTPEFESKVEELLAAWRKGRRPVIHVQHMSVEPDSLLRPGLPGNAFKREALPMEGEPVFQKRTSSAFIGTGLEVHLREQGIAQLVIAGLTTDHCVSSTARMASDIGFKVTVVSDATAAHERRAADGSLVPAEEMQRASLASLAGEFSTIRSTAELLG